MIGNKNDEINKLKNLINDQEQKFRENDHLTIKKFNDLQKEWAEKISNLDYKLSVKDKENNTQKDLLKAKTNEIERTRSVINEQTTLLNNLKTSSDSLYKEFSTFKSEALKDRDEIRANRDKLKKMTSD